MERLDNIEPVVLCRIKPNRVIKVNGKPVDWPPIAEERQIEWRQKRKGFLGKTFRVASPLYKNRPVTLYGKFKKYKGEFSDLEVKVLAYLGDLVFIK